VTDRWTGWRAVAGSLLVSAAVAGCGADEENAMVDVPVAFVQNGLDVPWARSPAAASAGRRR
jgi:hypothetical protein